MSTNQEAPVEQFYYNHNEQGYYTNATPADYHAFDQNPDGSPYVMPPPYLATLTPVPAIPERKWAKYVNDQWVLVDNWVGFEYWLADRTSVKITEFEVVPPEGYLTEDPGPSLDDVKREKTNQLYRAYLEATRADIEYLSVGEVVGTYQANESSLTALGTALDGFETTPAGYFWLDAQNTRVPFTREDLSGLRAEIATRDFQLFTRYQDYKASVVLATKKEQVALVAWE